MHKILGISTSSFLPTDNDIEKRGRALRVSSDRVGRMERAKEHSSKRAYVSDGSYTSLKVSENRLRVKGSFCFQNMEITESKEGMEKDPKFSLLTCHQDVIFLGLELMVRRLVREGGKNIIIYYQIDGTGPHQCKKV